mgnify:CR=1 FL=1
MYLINLINSLIKKFFYIVYKILFIIDLIINKIIRKRFFYWFREFFEKDSYKIIKLKNKELVFFTPNEITDWRVHTFFSKEPDTLEWIDNFKGDKIIFWDIGANIGLYSIYAAIKHKEIKIISFEPSVNNLRILSRNIYKNNLTNSIKIFQLPLSENKNIFSNMNENEFIEGWSMSNFGDLKNSEGKNFSPKHSYKIFGTNINYLLDNKIIPFPNYIKIDVDGIEHKILNGASNHLSDFNLKSILVELNENYSEQYHSVINLMSKNNFNRVKSKTAASIDKEKVSKTLNHIFEK